MRLVDKYILRSFLSPLFYGLFIFIFTYVIIDLFGHLDEIIKERIGLQLLIVYYLSYIPAIITQVMPIALLIATMYTLGGLAKHNEITALRASGISLWKILKPFLTTGVFISAFILVINDSIVPRSTQLFLKIKEEKIEKKKTSGSATNIVKNVALYGVGNKIIYARSLDPKINILKDVVVQEHDKKQNIISKTTAKEARWTKDGWMGFSLTTYKLDRDGRIIKEPKFKHRDILNIKEGPREFQTQKYKTETLTLSELKNYKRRLSATSGSILQNLLVETHNRIAYPFANIVAVLIGAAFCLKAKRSSGLLGIGLGLLIGLLFYGVFAVSTALGKGGLLPPFVSAWFANILFGSLGIYLINKY
jgi:lipopolysaccharide export system permease protein